MRKYDFYWIVIIFKEILCDVRCWIHFLFKINKQTINKNASKIFFFVFFLFVVELNFWLNLRRKFCFVKNAKRFFVSLQTPNARLKGYAIKPFSIEHKNYYNFFFIIFCVYNKGNYSKQKNTRWIQIY